MSSGRLNAEAVMHSSLLRKMRVLRIVQCWSLLSFRDGQKTRESLLGFVLISLTASGATR